MMVRITALVPFINKSVLANAEKVIASPRFIGTKEDARFSVTTFAVIENELTRTMFGECTAENEFCTNDPIAHSVLLAGVADTDIAVPVAPALATVSRIGAFDPPPPPEGIGGPAKA